MFSSFHKGVTELEIRQINFVFHFAFSNKEVAGFDIAVENIGFVEILHSIEDLQSDHE